MQEEDLKELNLKLFHASTQALQDLESKELSPKSVEDYQIHLTSLYALLSDEKALIDQRRPRAWLILKENNTNKEADMLWDSSEDGQRRIILSSRLVAINKMISSLSGRMWRLNKEATHEGFKLNG